MSESTPNPVKKVIARRTAVVELVVAEYSDAKELRIGAEGEDPAMMIYVIEDPGRQQGPDRVRRVPQSHRRSPCRVTSPELSGTGSGLPWSGR